MWTVLDDEFDIKYTILDIEDELLDRLEDDIRKTGDKVYDRSNVKGTMTPWRTHLKSFFELEKHIANVLDFTPQYINHWGLIYRDGDYAKPHLHQPEDDPTINKSFVFYISTPEGSGEIHFVNNDIYLTPQRNMLVVFNDNAIHEVLPNTISGIERIATAGNIDFSVDNV